MQLKLISCHPLLFSVMSTQGLAGGLAGGGGGCGGTTATPVESVTFSFPLSSAESTYTHTFMGSNSSPVSSSMN